MRFGNKSSIHSKFSQFVFEKKIWFFDTILMKYEDALSLKRGSTDSVWGLLTTVRLWTLNPALCGSDLTLHFIWRKYSDERNLYFKMTVA